jgi:hypothetical protein
LENIFLDEKTAHDIDSRIAKILRDIGNPEPPLRLEIVRDLLELDKAFYSSADGSVLQETVHRLKMAGKQVIKRPRLLFDVVKKLDLKALWLPDRKRILLDSELSSAKQRWGEAHEIGHSIIPWHEMIMHGDRKLTLNLSCQEQIEAEANYAAGRMLFLQGAFTDRLFGSPLSFEHVKSLGKEFGNTMTSTLWRTIESQADPVFGLVSRHPHHESSPDKDDIRYFLRSPRFAVQFSHVTGGAILARLATFCRNGRGPLGSSEVLIPDVDRTQHVFFVECFFNSYDALTLGTYRGVRTTAIAVPGIFRGTR